MTTTRPQTDKHTPGDWQSHDTDYCPEEIWGNLEGPLEDGRVHGTHICTIADTPDFEGNRKLVIAAPMLLQALRDAPIPSLQQTPVEFLDRFFDWLHKVQTPAIKKAIR